MQKLNLNNCKITREHFVPNVIMDRNLYDDITIESGVFICDVMCVNDTTEINKASTKLIMMLEAYNDGYIKAIHGYEVGLQQVFGVVGYPRYKYLGGNVIEFEIDIVSLSYNPYMHMAVMNDCLSAGAATSLMPDSRKYFELKMDDCLIKKEASEEIIQVLESQKDLFRKTIVDNMRPLV